MAWKDIDKRLKMFMAGGSAIVLAVGLLQIVPSPMQLEEILLDKWEAKHVEEPIAKLQKVSDNQTERLVMIDQRVIQGQIMQTQRDLYEYQRRLTDTPADQLLRDRVLELQQQIRDLEVQAKQAQCDLAFSRGFKISGCN